MQKGDLRIVFFGTTDFGYPTLNALMLNGYNVVGVVTKPDYYNPRKKKTETTPIKDLAEELELPILQPTNLESKDFHAKLGALNGNIFIVIAYQMIPESVLAMAKYGAFNIHGSLLPDYRGAAPINWAIANGEKRIGLTSFYLNKKMDDGDIICQTSIPNYSGRNFIEIYKMLSLGPCIGLCGETLRFIMEADGKPNTIKQDLTQYKHKAPKLTHENTKLDLSNDVNDVLNHIRAFSDKPGAWCTIKSDDKYNGKSIKIFDAKLVSNNSSNTVKNKSHFTVVDDGLLLFVSNGCLKINELQLEGCKKMKLTDFLNGYENFVKNWELI